MYNINKNCDPPPLCSVTSNIKQWANRADIEKQLGVETNKEWVQCDGNVNQKMAGDHVTNMALKIPTVLNSGVRVLVYSGDLDYICNWRGGQAWTHKGLGQSDTNPLWAGAKPFAAAPDLTWKVDGNTAGTYNYYDNLTFLRFHDAGHQVPQD